MTIILKSSNTSTSNLGKYNPFSNAVSGALAVYAMKRIVADYSGPCLQVQRSSDNAVMDIQFLPNSVDVDVPTLQSFCGSGNGSISIWYDQSGLGVNANQPTQASQPKLVSAGVANLDTGILCSVNASTSPIGLTVPVNLPSPFMGFLIGRKLTATGGGFWGNQAADTNTEGVGHYSVSLTTLHAEVFNNSGVPVSTADVTISGRFQSVVSYDGTNILQRVNGVDGTPVPGTYGSNHGTEVGLGAQQLNSGFIDGNFQAFALLPFNSALRLTCDQWLNRYFKVF